MVHLQCEPNSTFTWPCFCKVILFWIKQLQAQSWLLKTDNVVTCVYCSCQVITHEFEFRTMLKCDSIFFAQCSYFNNPNPDATLVLVVLSMWEVLTLPFSVLDMVLLLCGSISLHVSLQHMVQNEEPGEHAIHTHYWRAQTCYYIHMTNPPIQSLVPANHLVRTWSSYAICPLGLTLIYQINAPITLILQDNRPVHALQWDPSVHASAAKQRS